MMEKIFAHRLETSHLHLYFHDMSIMCQAMPRRALPISSKRYATRLLEENEIVFAIDNETE